MQATPALTPDTPVTPLSPPPGPPGRPLFGSILEAWRDPLKLFTQNAVIYGDVVKFRFGPFDYVLYNSAEAARHLLVDASKKYKKSRNYQGLKLVLGQGLVTSEGELWRRQRKLVQPAFAKERLASFVDTFARDTATMLERWTAMVARAPGLRIDAHEEMLHLTFRIVGHTLFSAELASESVSGVAAEDSEIGAAIGVCLKHANDVAESLIRLPPWVPTPANFVFNRAVRKLDTLVLAIIQERRESRAKGAASRGDLLDLLLDARVEGEGQMSDQQLRDEVMTLALAGHETTANALSWTWVLLSRHPDVERKLRAEVDEVLGDRLPTVADLPKLKYTAMVVQESMRLYPPVWIVEREALEEDVLTSSGTSHRIKKGSIVSVSPWALHRNERYWPNPEGFDPERFAPAAVEQRPRGAYLPFAVGPRQCIGNQFALMEAQVILAMIVRRFRLSLVPGHAIVPDPGVTLRPKHGVPVHLHAQSAPSAQSTTGRVSRGDVGDLGEKPERGVAASGCPFHAGGAPRALEADGPTSSH